MSKNIKKLVFKTTAGVLFFATSCAAGYMLTPMRQKNVNLGTRMKQETFDESNSTENFMKFVSRLNEDTGILEEKIDEENTYYGFNLAFDNFNVSFKKDEFSAVNNLGIDGNVDLTIRTIKDISFNLDVNVNYNNKEIPVEVGYVDKTAYFGIKDLRVKCGSTTFDELFGQEENGVDGLIYQLFIASKEEGGIGFDFERWIDDVVYELIENKLLGSIFNSLDLSSLSSELALKELEEGENGFGIKVTEKEVSNGFDFTLDMEIRTDESDNKFKIVLGVDEDYRLRRVDLGSIQFGNIALSGAIDITPIANYHIVAPDKENYPHGPTRNYVEVINYRGWLQKIANFIDEDNQKFAVDFNLDLDKAGEETNSDFGVISGSINADFSDLIDISSYTKRSRGLLDNEKVTNILNKVRFGVDFKIFDSSNEEVSNLSISYVDGAGYLKLNETEDAVGQKRSVVKSKVDTETMNWIMNDLPGMIANFSGESDSSNAMGELFSFVTESTFVTSIKNGDYSTILDLLKNIENNENSLEIGLNLSSLGFGENAEVALAFDSRTGAQNKVLNVDISNVEMGSFVFNAGLNTNNFKEIKIDEEESYDEMSYLPTVFDQVANIVDTKKTGFTIQGSILDADHVGITLDGKGQLDLGNKFGFGDLTLNEYKYKGAGLYYSHKLAVDVDNTTSDYTKNNAHFVYGPKNGDNIKGKVTIQSVLDIIEVGKDFLNDNKENPKFTKFIDPIVKMMSLGEFGNIITESNYLRLLKNDLVKSAKKNGNQLDLTIGGELFDLENDMVIRVNLKEGKIDSLQLINFELSGGKILNISISLADYEEGRESSVDKSNMKQFMDLSSISLLLKFGINTTKNNYYHISADINLDLKLIKAFDLELEMYIVVQDSYCKIYGVIEDSKISFAAQDYNDITTSGLKSEFTFETYPDGDPYKEDGVGGYFHFKVTEYRRFSSDRYYHYKTTSKNLLEPENLVRYLLRDFLYMRETIVSGIGGIDLSKDEQKPAGDFTKTFTSTGFSYNESQKKWSIGLNLDVLTGVDALKELEINIYGNSQEKLSKLEGSLGIQAFSLGSFTVKIGAKFTFTLEDVSSSVTDWPSSIQSKFTKINSVYFSDEYLNNPREYLNK